MPTETSEPKPTTMTGVAFVHLSDIHFHFKRNGTLLDRDSDIAHQLILDAARLSSELGGCDGVLVNGDLAFNGKLEEYELAIAWLADLSDALRCDPLAVWPVPGNHDVQRPQPTAPTIRDTLIRDLRKPEHRAQVNDLLRGHLESEDGDSVLFRCLRQYNEFAGRHSCAVRAKVPFWHEDLPLNDGSTLRLHGLTSVIASNGDDDDGANKLVLGEFQVSTPTLREDPSVVHMVMCHHPPNWILDSAEVEPQLNARARIQLFGHEHKQQIQMIDNSLRIVAGAVAPLRDERWEPRYNVLQIAVERRASRGLLVVVHPRVWDTGARTFVEAAGGARREFRLELPEWTPTVIVAPPSPKIATSAVSGGEPAPAPATANRIFMSPERRLTYRFFQLPYAVRLDVIAKLGLNADEDRGVTDPELTRKFFERARQRRLLDKLWDELRIRLGLPPEPNPFAQATPSGDSHV